jgi:hypothetical protein
MVPYVKLVSLSTNICLGDGPNTKVRMGPESHHPDLGLRVNIVGRVLSISQCKAQSKFARITNSPFYAPFIKLMKKSFRFPAIYGLSENG